MRWSWSRTSLRGRLIVSTALATSAILGLLALSLYFSMKHALLKEFDDTLTIKAQSLAALTEVHDDHFVFEGELEKMLEFAPSADPQYFQVVLPDDRVLASSPSLAKNDLRPQLDPSGARYRFVTLPSGHPGRMVVYRFKPRFEHDEGGHEEKDRAQKGEPMITAKLVPGDVTIIHARPTEKLDATTRSLGSRLIVLGLAAVAISAALMTLIIGRGMRPVSHLAHQIGAIDEENLDARITLPGAVPELGPVVIRLNDLLHRLQAAMEREKSFSADVAHELRTPLSGVQTALEVCSSHARTPEQYRRTINDCLKVTRQMGGMVENLLMLARVESGHLKISNAPVDLIAALMDCWVSYAPRAAARDLQIEWDLPEGIVANTDAEKLSLIIRNLLDNAVSYTDRGGTIRISASADENRLHLRIANSGSTLSSEELENLFQRFWRQDKARNNDTGHHGLGLALSQRIARALGATLAARSPQTGWIEMELSLPAHVLAEEPVAAGI